jgi:hypothetical protein
VAFYDHIPYATALAHRGLSHSLAFALVLALAGAWLHRRPLFLPVSDDRSLADRRLQVPVSQGDDRAGVGNPVDLAAAVFLRGRGGDLSAQAQRGAHAPYPPSMFNTVPVM